MSFSDHAKEPKLQPLRARDRKRLELGRRDFLQLVGASVVLSQVDGCAPDRPEPSLPYTHRSLAAIPGITARYATSFLLDGLATGLIAQTREGRPIKIEGNPDHPASLGATSALHQAALWQLYDPDRASSLLRNAKPASWNDLRGALREELDPGARLRLVLEPTSSPLVHEMIGVLKRKRPGVKVCFSSPLASSEIGDASSELYGGRLSPQYDVSRARVLVALDADILGTPNDLSHARRFAELRTIDAASGEPCRLYVIEASLSITGTMADHRLARAPSRIGLLTAALAQAIGLPDLAPAAKAQPLGSALDDEEQRFIRALAGDLRSRAPGETLVVAGPRQPRELHVLAFAINEALRNVGSALSFTEQVIPDAASDQTLAELTRELAAGEVDSLVLLGVNPVYDAPADLGFAEAMARARHVLCADLYRTETAHRAHWFAPLSHAFESWGDGRAPDGTLSLIQPLIGKLRSGRSISELLALLAGEPASDYARLRARFGAEHGETWSRELSAAEQDARKSRSVEASWERTLATGFVPDTAFAHTAPVANGAVVTRAFDALSARAAARDLELSFLPSPSLHDGRFSNVAWLLELPTPVAKLTWDNAALLSERTARELGVYDVVQQDQHRVLRIRQHGRSVELPALVAPGHADGVITLWLGYGRAGDLELARGVGFDVNPLRSSWSPGFEGGAQVEALDARYPLAITQADRDMRGRPIALTSTLEHYRKNPHFTAEHKGPLPSLLPEYALSGPQWAMSIDLSKCIGCNACVVACQAENNVLVVGKEQVRRGRQMHWLRIDSYENAEGFVHQPMACQHCEKAPCEYVCPVNATEHSPDGLNEMVYNRCVGTRFCSNNCPYKVRRFNWLDWVGSVPANQGQVQLQRNPEVTVRDRGVMEKCTYCVQRIRSAEIEARKEEREIQPGEVVTACQQACPTRAISFDSLTHTQSPMVRWREQPRSYAALHETGARPRTMYLARITNPNPELER